MNKCLASENGECRIVYGCGVKCNGYSETCKLRPAYNSIENIARNLAKNIRKAYGIVGDQEEE